MKKTYPAIFFRQRLNAPLQVAFVAPSREIDSWARVPTKKTGNVRNFQRAEIAMHIQEVQRFSKTKTTRRQQPWWSASIPSAQRTVYGLLTPPES